MEIITELLSIICTFLKADRVVLAEIHSSDYHGYKVYDKVFSITHEYLTEGTPSIKHQVQNIPIDVLKVEEEYYTNGVLIVSKHSGLPSKCLNHLDNINVSCMINATVKFNSFIIGILSVHYIEPITAKVYDDLHAETKMYLNLCCSLLSRLL